MMDKDDFKKFLKDFIERNNIKPATHFEDPEGSIIVVAAVVDFDPKSNDLWDIPENRSYPRPLCCVECFRPVVMSDAMYKMYQEVNPKPSVACSKCVFKI